MLSLSAVKAITVLLFSLPLPFSASLGDRRSWQLDLPQAFAFCFPVLFSWHNAEVCSVVLPQSHAKIFAQLSDDRKGGKEKTHSSVI